MPRVITISCAERIPLRKKADSFTFQEKVLRVVSKIPLGELRTYAWVAKRIGKPQAVRAVGQALKKNPFSLIIPCHRVVKSDGSLGGYTGGKKMKKYLIALEKLLVQKLDLKSQL